MSEPALFQDGEIAGIPDKIAQSAFDAWNETAKPLNWRAALVLTDARRKTLRRAVKDYGGLAGFREALVRASKSPFLLGHVGRSGAHKDWKPDLDFICQPKSIIRLLEGFYDGEIEQTKKVYIPQGYQPPHLKPTVPFVPEPRDVRLAAMVVSFRKVGKWADANRIEEELAKLQARPPVLVPAPDVAHLGMPERPARTVPKPTITDTEWDMMEPEI